MTKIQELKSLISDYEEELELLEDIVYEWENYSEPASDPSLQFEQSLIIQESYEKIVEFTKTL